MVEWIVSTNPVKYKKYNNLLSGIKGEYGDRFIDIDDLDLTDLKEYGIINLGDRKLIYKSIRKLIINYKKLDKLITGYICADIGKVNRDIFSILNVIVISYHGHNFSAFPKKKYGNGGWLPPISSPVLLNWKKEVLAQAQSNMTKNVDLQPSVYALSIVIDSNSIICELANNMISEYKRCHNKDNNILLSRIESIDHMLHIINIIICQEPKFDGDDLIGLPLSALFTGVNSTLSGQSLFRITVWNKCIQNILKSWCNYLNKKESFPPNNSWLTETSKNKWAPKETNGMDLWVLPSSKNPYWDSWNSFFARDVNRKYRPISSPNNDNIITSANDGGLFRIRNNIKLCDTFWLKNMPYSLEDIFGGKDNELFKQYGHKFVNGSIIQTFLSPFDYHCWWAPVSGKILTKAVLPGLYYSKLVVPDYEGATTQSCPYLTHVNARGICIIDTKDHGNFGLVCCIPIGMGEVSSIVYEQDIKIGDDVKKGKKVGHFAFGGSSFAIIFEDITKYNKKLIFNKEFIELKSNPTNSPNGHHSNPINVGSKIAEIRDNNNKNNEILFTDRMGNKFTMDKLSNRLDLFEEAVELISNTFFEAEPTTKCANVTYEEIYYYFKTFMTKMKDTNCLNLTFIFLDSITKELAFVMLCDDLFNDKDIDLNENELRILSKMGNGNMIKVLENVELVAKNGINEMAKDRDNVNDKYISYILNREKGHFFHGYIAAAKNKYRGNGGVLSMMQAIGVCAINEGYSYSCAENTNPITQHLATKYGKAKTYYQNKFMGKAVTMFQVSYMR